MTQYVQIGGMNVPYMASHLGGTTIVPNGTAIALTLPAGAACAYMIPEGAAAYYAVNLGTASASSAGYVPVDCVGLVPPVDNMGTLCVYAGSGGTVHIQYYSTF